MGKADLTSVISVSNSIGKALKAVKNYKVICVKSTVPPRTTENTILLRLKKQVAKQLIKTLESFSFQNFLEKDLLSRT